MDNNLPNWMKELSEEDYQFIKRFILASGSLKEMAAQLDELGPETIEAENRKLKPILDRMLAKKQKKPQ